MRIAAALLALLNGGTVRQGWFDAPSFRPGQTAILHVTGPHAPLGLQIFEAGGVNRSASGLAVTPTMPLRVKAATLRIGAWPSGVYVVRLTGPRGRQTYAPLIVRPQQLGRSHVLVVEPTNTWQAYNFARADSWYLDPSVQFVDLTRPYLGDGLPPYFRSYDLGFLRWYWRSGARADFVSDADLERFTNGAQLRHLYRLIVFPGHEEYVTPHAYDVIEQFRDLGGNLAFLSADNFFYRVTYNGRDMVGRTRWRDLGRPEAALVGAEYAGWEQHRYPNRPYRVVDTAAAPWLFAGTGLHNGSLFGHYGIEIDQRGWSSPPGTRVLATIPDDFGPNVSAEMTIYRHGSSTVFDAGVINFGATSDWPIVSRLLDNLWRHLS